MFLDCCGSRRWAEIMELSRPFGSEEELFARADEIWGSLDNAEWLEAFAAHPKIGGRKAEGKQQRRSAEWSKGEQAAVGNAEEAVLEQLSEANGLYQDKFGFIFIICATGKSGDEVLSACRSRMENRPGKEIMVAAEEQRKITAIRLRKLLNQ